MTFASLLILAALTSSQSLLVVRATGTDQGSFDGASPPQRNLRAAVAATPSARLGQRRLENNTKMSTDGVCYPLNQIDTDTDAPAPVPCDPSLVCEFQTCGFEVWDDPVIIKIVENELCPFPGAVQVRIGSSPTDDPLDECSDFPTVSCCMDPSIGAADDLRKLGSSGAAPLGKLRAAAVAIPLPQVGQRQLLPTTNPTEEGVCYQLNGNSTDDLPEVVPCDPSLDCYFFMCGFEPSDDATASEILEYGLCPYDGPVQVRVERSSSDGPTRCYSSSVSCCVGPDSIWKGNY